MNHDAGVSPAMKDARTAQRAAFQRARKYKRLSRKPLAAGRQIEAGVRPILAFGSETIDPASLKAGLTRPGPGLN